MKSLLLTMVLVMLSFSITLAAEPTIEEIKSGGEIQFRFEIELKEGTSAQADTKDTWATAYGLLSEDGKVYFYVEADEGFVFDGTTSSNFLTSQTKKGNGAGGLGDDKVGSDAVFNTDNTAWTANVDVNYAGGDSFSIGVVANSTTGESGFGSGGFDEIPETRQNIPIDGGLGVLALAGLGYGLYKKRK